MKQFKIKSIHLDTARTFIPIDELYDRVNEFSSLGFTHMQLHLSDDQGWRFESLKYPKLTLVGSTRDRLLLSNTKSIKPDAKPCSGFYSQQELKDLLVYANNKNIQLIPAIDIPGHCSAAIVAYPELSSGLVFDKVPSLRGSALYKSRGSTICYTSEFTKNWIKDIYTELMEVFSTSEYIHMGFDEIAKGTCSTCGNCNLSTLTELLRIGYDTILSKGKKPIVWWANEKNSFDFNLFPELTLQWWGNASLTDKNIKYKNDVIFSQPNTLYFDYPESMGARITVLDDMGTVIVRPNALFSREKKFPVNVVGVGCCFWSENFYSREIRDDYMYPRLLNLANILNGNDMGDFIQPMGAWSTSSYGTYLIKLLRGTVMSYQDRIKIRNKMDEVSMGEFLVYLDTDYPKINFRSIPLTRISTSVKNSLARAESDDIEIINKLYGVQ